MAGVVEESRPVFCGCYSTQYGTQDCGQWDVLGFPTRLLEQDDSLNASLNMLTRCVHSEILLPLPYSSYGSIRVYSKMVTRACGVPQYGFIS